MSFPCSLLKYTLNRIIDIRCVKIHYISTFSKLLVKEKYILKKQSRLEQKTMEPICDSNLLSPPECIRGLKHLDKSIFNKQIELPAIELGDVVISKVMPFLKKYILKMENLKPVQSNIVTDRKALNSTTKVNKNSKYVLLNPIFVREWLDINDSDKHMLMKAGITSEHFKVVDFTIGYENWKADELLRYILPEDKHSVAGFSKIGHIIHLNLRDHVMDYKHIVGEILLDKIAGCRTVVNKLDKIDNTYRNFEMEILCGDKDMLVKVKENHCTFEFDFSTVYWNPRLSTEHERIVDILKPGDILYDIFAGVGPFSIPAAKKKCSVHANDLNPESFNWLNHNAKINKIKSCYLQTFNKDGREFIKTDLKNDLIKQLRNSDVRNIYITMNLPGLAPEFLPAFNGLLYESGLDSVDINNYPTVYVYCFAKGEDPVQIARDLVETNLGRPLPENYEIFNVRKVSSNKEMMRVSFKLNRDILYGYSCKKRAAEEHTTTDLKKCV